MKRLLRIILPTALGAISLLAMAVPASANSRGLYGGGECYGTGRTTYSSSGAVDAITFMAGYPCNSYTQVYLEATTPAGYSDLAGSWGYVAIYWGTAAPSVAGTHNLCHYSCNGYVGTSAP